MNGYPGVSFVAPNTGQQIGSPAARDTNDPPSLVKLQPGQSALAGFDFVGSLSQSCPTQITDGVRVYPPGNTAAAYAPINAMKVCPTTDVPRISAVQSLSQ